MRCVQQVLLQTSKWHFLFARCKYTEAPIICSFQVVLKTWIKNNFHFLSRINFGKWRFSFIFQINIDSKTMPAGKHHRILTRKWLKMNRIFAASCCGCKRCCSSQRTLFLFFVWSDLHSVFQQKPATSFQITKIYNERKKSFRNYLWKPDDGKTELFFELEQIIDYIFHLKAQMFVMFERKLLRPKWEIKKCETVVLQECGRHILKKEELK